MFRLIGFGLAIATLIFGFITARRFVRERLRYVDAVQGRRAALLAGVGAAVLSALPFAFVPLPFFGLGTSLFFGFSVGAGVRAGTRDIRSGTSYIEGP